MFLVPKEILFKKGFFGCPKNNFVPEKYRSKNDFAQFCLKLFLSKKFNQNKFQSKILVLEIFGSGKFLSREVLF